MRDGYLEPASGMGKPSNVPHSMTTRYGWNMNMLDPRMRSTMAYVMTGGKHGAPGSIQALRISGSQANG